MPATIIAAEERLDLEVLLRDLSRLESIFEPWEETPRAAVTAYSRALEALNGEALRRLVRALKSDPAALAANLRDRGGLWQVMIEWRVSTIAGLMGALASMGWFTAYALRSAVDVRIVGLVEVVFSYLVSRRFFEERVNHSELAGILLVVIGIVVISLGR